MEIVFFIKRILLNFLVYGPLFCSMGRYSVLCAFVLFYVPSSAVFVPLFSPMSHRFVLWAFISSYVPSYRSIDRHRQTMCRHPILWTINSVLCSIRLHSVILTKASGIISFRTNVMVVDRYYGKHV